MPSLPKTSVHAVLAAILVMASTALPAAGQAASSAGAGQLPPELKGAKIYHLPKESGSGEALQNLVTTRRVTYQDISTERLLLNVYVSIQPVDRDATVTKMYFENVRVGGFPVHLQPFDQEFKLSKNQAVDLPGPLQCSVVYSDLDSIAPLRELVDKEKILVTGDSFIQVRLNTVQKIFMRSKDVVIPVKFSQEVPFEMFTDSPLMKLAAGKVLDVISDPTTTAAVTLAKEHVEKFTRERALSSLAHDSVYMLYCEYVLRNPAGASEKFTQSGTGFVVGADGKILTAKRVIQPWKFDPQVAYLMAKYHLELDPKGYRLVAWPAGAATRLPGGQLNFQSALSEEQQTLQVLKVAADKPEKVEYHDADSGETATVSMEAEGENDVALLQAHGDKFQPLTLGGPADANSPASLLGYPYGLSQPSADPKQVDVKPARQGSFLALDEPLDPGEAGAPLVNAAGKVVGLAGDGKMCIPTEAFRGLIP
jgi:S1-C subfamily serine protease